MNIRTFYIILFLLGWLLSCSPVKNADSQFQAQAQKDSTETIYVAKHGWHTGIIIEKSSLDTIFPALVKKFPQSVYLDISWGDKKYFMSPEDNVLLALRAALIPTQSVVRVVSIPYDPENYFSDSKVRAFSISMRDFYQMVDYIKKTFVRTNGNKLIPAGKGGIYFLSGRKYWGLRTCNEWTARALKAGGVQIIPIFSLTSGSLMKRLPTKQKD